MADQDVSIRELVDKINRGEIRLPEMQRKYVWQKTRVRDLLDSLYRGYPSGSILTWETDEDVPERDTAIDQNKSNNNFQLLLDGQQRLTSLSAVLKGKLVTVRGLKKPIDILFNLDHPDKLEDTDTTEVFEDEEPDDEYLEDDTDLESVDVPSHIKKMTFIVYHKSIANLPNWVSVTRVFKKDDDGAILQEAGITDFKDPRYKNYSARLKRLKDIRNYEYRVHVLGRDKSYEEVTDIFVRVNSLGAKLRGSDLALAQITAKWPGSLKIFQEFQEEWDKNGFSLDLSIYLKVMVAFATGQSRFKSVGGLDVDTLQKAWEEAKRGINFSLGFLKSNVGIDGPELLSSPFLVVSIAYYWKHRSHGWNPEEKRELRYWALIANAKGRYSRGSTETFLDQDLGAIKDGKGIQSLLDMLRTQVGRLDIQPSELENRNSRSAYFKTMFMAFKDGGAQDWCDPLAMSLKHAGAQHRLQFHHIFPRAVLDGAVLEGKLDPKLINDICNLSFISGKTNRWIGKRKPVEYLPEVINKAGADQLTKQCIPLSKELWSVDAYHKFLDARRTLIAKRLNDYLGHSNGDGEK